MVESLLRRVREDESRYNRLPRTLRVTVRPARNPYRQPPRSKQIPFSCAPILQRKDCVDVVVALVEQQLPSFEMALGVINVGVLNFSQERLGVRKDLSEWWRRVGEPRPSEQESCAQSDHHSLNNAAVTATTPSNDYGLEAEEDVEMEGREGVWVECGICALRVPAWAIEAHSRFHDDESDKEREIEGGGSVIEDRNGCGERNCCMDYEHGRKKKKACGSEVHDEEDYNWNLKDTSMWGLNNESEEDLDGEVEHEEDELTSRMRKRKS